MMQKGSFITLVLFSQASNIVAGFQYCVRGGSHDETVFVWWYKFFSLFYSSTRFLLHEKRKENEEYNCTIIHMSLVI